MLVRWVLLAVSLSFCDGNEPFSVVVPRAPVYGLFGSSVTLPCSISPTLNAQSFEVLWYRPREELTPILFYQDQKIQENPKHPQYQGRVSLLGGLDKGNASLKLENIRLADKGEYICRVEKTDEGEEWYDEATVSLQVKVGGSTPVLSVSDVGGGRVNVFCRSHGWTPEPSLSWTDGDGRNLKDLSTDMFTTDSEGLVSVSSWLLVSRSASDRLSCSVGFSDSSSERKESLVLLYTSTVRGSAPVLSVSDVGGGRVNVSCQSHGWTPEPSLSWTDGDGRNLKHLSTDMFTKDSEGLVSVSSWLLVSPSASDRLSCSVGFSDSSSERKESLVLLYTSTGAESWKAVFIITLILLLLCIIGIAVYCVLHKKGLISFKRKETIKSPEAAVELQESTPDPIDRISAGLIPFKRKETVKNPEEGVPLNPSPVDDDQQKQKNPETVNISNPAPSKPDIELQESIPDTIDQLFAGLNNLTVSETPSSVSPVSLTIDPNETPHFLSVRNQGKSVSFSNTGEDNENPEEEKIFTLCKEKFSSGKLYWEVKLKEGYIEKLSWFVGVASDTAERMYKTALAPENGFWVLGYEKDLGVHIIDKVKSIPLNFRERIVKLRVLLDCDNHTLSFYNAETQSLIHTFTNVTPKSSLYPLISPGIKDNLPITIS